MAVIHIIEDDDELLQLLQLYFNSKGFEVIADYNGDQFTSADTHLADIYLIDIQLVNKNGLELSRQIKSGKIQKPVILMSGHRDLKQMLIESQADQFVEKPFQLNDLLHRIHGILSPPAAEQGQAV